jgi:hypothetical protein
MDVFFVMRWSRSESTNNGVSLNTDFNCHALFTAIMVLRFPGKRGIPKCFFSRGGHCGTPVSHFSDWRAQFLTASTKRPRRLHPSGGVVRNDMESPLARVILATLGGYLLILLCLSVYDWVLEEYPRRPIESLKPERIQHPFHHHQAVRALQLFYRLPKPDQTTIKDRLQSNLFSKKSWLAHLGQSNFQIICMGELHKESTRSFLSNHFFSNFSVDILLLETTPINLTRLFNRLRSGQDYFPLLDADIMTTLRAVMDKNPDVKMYGIEESAAQTKQQNGLVEALVYFMDEIGIEKRDFVIPDTRKLPEDIYEWFPLLTRQTLGKYQALIVFRD